MTTCFQSGVQYPLKVVKIVGLHAGWWVAEALGAYWQWKMTGVVRSNHYWSCWSRFWFWYQSVRINNASLCYAYKNLLLIHKQFFFYIKLYICWSIVRVHLACRNISDPLLWLVSDSSLQSRCDSSRWQQHPACTQQHMQMPWPEFYWPRGIVGSGVVVGNEWGKWDRWSVTCLCFVLCTFVLG